MPKKIYEYDNKVKNMFFIDYYFYFIFLTDDYLSWFGKYAYIVS